MAQGGSQGAALRPQAHQQGSRARTTGQSVKQFKYFDKGKHGNGCFCLARFRRPVAPGWQARVWRLHSLVAWLVLKLYYLVGHPERIAPCCMGDLGLGHSRGQMAITSPNGSTQGVTRDGGAKRSKAAGGDRTRRKRPQSGPSGGLSARASSVDQGRGSGLAP